jgi:hypothetical protein
MGVESGSKRRIPADLAHIQNQDPDLDLVQNGPDPDPNIRLFSRVLCFDPPLNKLSLELVAI